MSTSEENGKVQLTRKQLRELRLTGSTPIVSDEEEAAVSPPASVLPRAAEPADIPPAPRRDDAGHAPLTRRQMRALEHATAGEQEPEVVEADVEPEVFEPEVLEPEAAASSSEASAPAAPDRAPIAPESAHEADRMQDSGLVSGVPDFDEPVPAAADREPFPPMFERPVEPEPESAPEPEAVPEALPEPKRAPRRPIMPEVMDRGLMVPGHADDEREEQPEYEEREEPAPVHAPAQEERPKVGAAFGIGVRPRHDDPIVGAHFDDLLDGTASSSQHGTSTALIFTPSPGVGSLSGPIASTGELLITGTYTLPEGLGSHGHAFGAGDGRAADAGFMDTELAPASSPTPIAASSAVSTSRAAGEVITPPTPDKGNKLMVTLAIVAGGLAIVLATTLVIAFTTGVFG